MTDPIVDIFCEEARENLAALEKGFLDLDEAETPRDRAQLIDMIFRHAHSLKGDARAVGLEDLQKQAQVLEDVLDGLREDPDQLSRSSIDRGLAELDEVRKTFEVWEHGTAPDTEESVDPTGQSQAAPDPAAGTQPQQQSEAAAESVETATQPGSRDRSAGAAEETFTVRVPAERLDRMLSRVGEVRVSQRSADALAHLLSGLTTEVSDLLRWARQHKREFGGFLANGGPSGGTGGSGESDTQEARFAESFTSDANVLCERLESALERLNRVEGDFQKKQSHEALLLEALEADIQQARLLPLRMLTDSLRRTVRDLSQSLGKKIRYVTDVSGVMLDKAVIEALKTPMQHLLRNAADHGIETAEQRREANKPEEGTIRIHAQQRGPMVHISLSDDGGGVNYEYVRNRLRQMEGLDDEELSALSDPELCQILFRPGFSTTATAGDISGRGVGLDAVADAVHALHGEVRVASSSPEGTQFAITVPVSISTVRMLTVIAGGQYYGIPSTTVVRTGRAGTNDLRVLEGSSVLPINGQPIRWVHLTDLTSTDESHRPGSGEWPFVLIENDGRRLAVAVDELEDESEGLLKGLGFPLGGLPGVIGATLRPDGSAQIALDLSHPVFGRRGKLRAAAPERKPVAGRILVVDDSATTRSILRNLFTAAGYTVRTAPDGVEALDWLRAHPTDVVVADVEMPRLNGFDLTRQIKSRFGLPVILVTAREKEEDRREGLDAGADAYVVKSTFEGESLLDVVRQFL